MAVLGDDMCKKKKIPDLYTVQDGVAQVVRFEYNPEFDSHDEFTRAFDARSLKGSFRKDDAYQKLLTKYKRLLNLCWNEGVFDRYNKKSKIFK